MKKQPRVDGDDEVTTNEETKPLEDVKPAERMPYFDGDDETEAML